MTGSSKRGSKPQKGRIKSYAGGGAVVDDDMGSDASVDVDKAADAIRSQSWMQHLGRTRKISSAADLRMALPTPQTNDKMPTVSSVPSASDTGAAKGGMVRRVGGKPVGREDGIIAVQKGEYVVKRSSAAKYGPAKMSAVNRGTAKITTKGRR